MIKVSIEEAAAFDMLAILEVKRSQTYSLEKGNSLLEQITDLSDEIMFQVGKDKFIEVYQSEEYAQLFTANENVFIGVDQAKDDLISAKDLDALNYERYKAKQKIQNNFFKNTLQEIKIGYQDNVYQET